MLIYIYISSFSIDINIYIYIYILAFVYMLIWVFIQISTGMFIIITASYIYNQHIYISILHACLYKYVHVCHVYVFDKHTWCSSHQIQWGSCTATVDLWSFPGDFLVNHFPGRVALGSLPRRFLDKVRLRKGRGHVLRARCVNMSDATDHLKGMVLNPYWNDITSMVRQGGSPRQQICPRFNVPKGFSSGWFFSQHCFVHVSWKPSIAREVPRNCEHISASDCSCSPRSLYRLIVGHFICPPLTHITIYAHCLQVQRWRNTSTNFKRFTLPSLPRLGWSGSELKWSASAQYNQDNIATKGIAFEYGGLEIDFGSGGFNLLNDLVDGFGVVY